LFGTRVKKLDLNDNSEIEGVYVQTYSGAMQRIAAKIVISTAPIDVLHNLVRFRSDYGDPPPLNLKWRSLRILYLSSPGVISSGHETYYFPGSDIIFGRVSEPAMYSPSLNQTDNRRALTIELPCTFDDEIWRMNDHELAERCIPALRRLKILSEKPNG